MARKRSESNQQHITIEVCASLLRLVVLRRKSKLETVTVTSQEIPWRKTATSLYSDIGRQELTAAFKRLVIDYKLSGAEVCLTLNGAFCVTRVITGESAHVKQEMADLEQRSQLYLSLGPGQKALAGSIRQIDARHQHALLTVTNQRTLDTILSASHDAGWNVRRIEPSLFALSRTLKLLKQDLDEPVMVLSLDEKGAEVGIFFNGMLLLDYRPGGRQVHQNVAEIIGQHLPRLQRYCSRYFRFINAKLSRVLLCGDEQFVQPVLADFANQAKLQVSLLTLDGISSDWNFPGGVPASTFAPVLGSGLSLLNPTTEDAGPNLLQHLQQQQSTQLALGARKFIWPVAVAASLIVAMLGLTLYQQRIVSGLEQQVAEFETVRSRARVLRLSLVQSETKNKLLDNLSRQLVQPSWSELWTTVGGCLPPNVWIDSFAMQGGEQVSISGTCFAENGAHEFVRWLKQVPELHDVALTSMRPVRFNSKPAISFQLDCRLLNLAGSAERKD